MPFRLCVREGILTSAGTDFLQKAYESATENIAVVDDATMHRVVRSMIRHYQAGAHDPYWLAILAKSELQRATG